MKNILLIEDDDSFRITVRHALKGRGFQVEEASSAEEALATGSPSYHPDGILLDMRLGNDDGMSLIPELKRLHPEARLVVLTGFGSIPQAMESLRIGADDYLLKPAGIEAIIGALQGNATPKESAFDGEPPSLARVEWEHIQRILHDCEGNVSRAARTLGIDRRTLQRKLAKQPPNL
ncbi:MAG: response regulator [Verrucomicrobiales bacterium]|nr:response regulator [Verrucomicrobiales bacterium]